MTPGLEMPGGIQDSFRAIRDVGHMKRAATLFIASLLVTACAGSGGELTTSTAPAVDGGQSTTSSPAETTTSGEGASSPDTTLATPSGTDEGSIVVEFLGTRHEFSVAKDIEVVPGSYYPTRCEANAYNGGFWVVSTALDDDGQMVSDYHADFMLFPDGTSDFGTNPRVTLPGDGSGSVYYDLDRDDPGTWTISGNRASGEMNLNYFGPEGTQEQTTATFEFICPG